ncbi:hypothetical protein SAMN05444365_10640 [Micromonospora pattaloongensis]|uniref:Secreted protein n=1 Tax=Micromonospora pattaloongensis TaxID=405436 RepID=A0A1H3QNJ9_9ACTN|nr:hypothetical protein [Micromonospora pattaloongensis]SDZ15132.1 hypothetical protein SAMN05444365_10640 [Micromonospora pattaloongensis]
MRFQKGLATLLVIAATLVGTVAITSPASAAAVEQCRGNSKGFSNGTATAQRNITITLCVQRVDVDTVRAYAEMTNGPKAGSVNIFYHFIINVRLERYDSDFETASCTATYNANGSTYGYMLTCATPFLQTAATGGWTADGNVSYDIIGDGKGDLTWSLTGSPAIS